ncbi:hypothetical protein PRIPAC_72171 [Pristionchus pacificus]|uniref:Uncharacterized protein n=1 Tax=Pristionchus pacificus TaxID=54126 RepID=A0A2A6CGH9_PRIPA|nr:hypothetical protein PRIPAC_72171 [Pristionchus pacificus]|eukprot:PDM77173.1 hypothetical protein PRIPAC_43085 [Pristionchus pacificus]
MPLVFVSVSYLKRLFSIVSIAKGLLAVSALRSVSASTGALRRAISPFEKARYDNQLIRWHQTARGVDTTHKGRVGVGGRHRHRPDTLRHSPSPHSTIVLPHTPQQPLSNRRLPFSRHVWSHHVPVYVSSHLPSLGESPFTFENTMQPYLHSTVLCLPTVIYSRVNSYLHLNLQFVLSSIVAVPFLRDISSTILSRAMAAVWNGRARRCCSPLFSPRKLQGSMPLGALPVSASTDA